MSDLLRLHDVCWHYDADENDSEWVIKGLNLSFQQGEYVAVMGPNGSGKSTFVKLLNGLLPTLRGKIELGKLTTSNKKHLQEIRRKIGIIFQNPDHQIVGNTVLEDIAFGLENLGFPRKLICSIVSETLNLVNLKGFENRNINQLSGGEKQKVIIAGILAMKPSVIVIDEAISLLDPQSTKDLISMFRDLNKHGITIIHITHCSKQAMCADRLILFGSGYIKLDCLRKDVFSYRILINQLGISLPIEMDILYKIVEEKPELFLKCTTPEEFEHQLWTLFSKT